MKDIPISPRITMMKRNRKIRRFRLGVLLSIFFVFLVVFASYFSSYYRLRINTIKVEGNSIIDEEKIELSIKEKISGKYLGLFSRSNVFIYPKDSIYSDLLKEFPRIEELSINKDGFNTLKIGIKERAGAYLYCGLVVPENKEDIGENCYFVNNDGYIFDKAPYFSGDVYFKFYSSVLGGATNPMGSSLVSSDRFHELVRFMDGVSSLGFNPAYLVVTLDGINSLYLVPDGDGLNPKIIFKEDNDLVVILDNFMTAMREKEFANEINSKYDTLSYIDLRFKNKVLYKFN